MTVKRRQIERIATHPGVLLRAEILQRNMTSADFAKHLGLNVRVIRAVLAGRGPVTAEIALRLARALKTSPDLWINLQCNHDLSKVRLASGKEIAKVKPLKLPHKFIDAPPGMSWR